MILYFSGTGNSRYVAYCIADYTEDEAPVSLGDRIRAEDCSPIVSGRPVVIVTPTYAWRIPRIVEQHLRRTRFEGDRRVYFVMTCGEDVGNAAKPLETLCRDMGLTFMGLESVVMPENYIAMFDVPNKHRADEIVRHAQPTISSLSHAIAQEQPFPKFDGGTLGAIKSGIVNRCFYPLFVSARGFRYTEKCNGCGLCEKVCPLDNVYLAGNRPRWSIRCTHCMACINLCPQEAIEYKNASVGKPRYHLAPPAGGGKVD